MHRVANPIIAGLFGAGIAIGLGLQVVAAQDAGSRPFRSKDCAECPEMVLVPAGSYVMGSPEGIGDDDERPQHEVSVPAFAVGKYEVTFAEFDACVAAGGCKHSPKDEGWGRGSRPAINVSWDDAKQYIAWLSRKTGRTYRLLTEAEWEYAARAGTTAARYWGEDAAQGCAHANAADRTARATVPDASTWAVAECADGHAYTAPVGSFRPNGFGLHDMIGNVWEWVEDCWNAGYAGAPTDGRAWTVGACTHRMLRSGSWGNLPDFARSAIRFWYEPEFRSYSLGFRVARS